MWMRLPVFFSSLLAAVALAAQPYSTWFADSVIDRGVLLGLDGNGAPFITYEHGVFERALEMVYNSTGNSSYLDYMTRGVDNVIADNGSLLDYNLTYYTLDDIRLGQSILSLYLLTGDKKYQKAAAELRLQLQTNPRNHAGGFWHRSTYPYQMWLDGLYMVEPFYAQYTEIFQPHNTTAWDDIVLQFTLVEDHTRNATTGLLKHGYDESFTAVWAQKPTGSSPEVWDRALGWYTMALLDVLDHFPTHHPGAAKLQGYFTRVMKAVKNAADPATGAWWLVMSQPGRKGNYIESSGSAMFVYSLLKGIRVGLLDKATYFPAAERAYQYIVDAFVEEKSNGTLYWEGTVQVGSLSGNGTFDYYISVGLNENDLKGLGPFIYASYEYELATA